MSFSRLLFLEGEPRDSSSAGATRTEQAAGGIGRRETAGRCDAMSSVGGAILITLWERRRLTMMKPSSLLFSGPRW